MYGIGIVYLVIGTFYLAAGAVEFAIAGRYLKMQARVETLRQLFHFGIGLGCIALGLCYSFRLLETF